MDHLIGHFYYRKTSNGNLLGEFSNNNLKVVKAEVAEPMDNVNDSFVGTYDSCWYEYEEANSLILRIVVNDDNEKMFHLTWSNKSKIIYWGGGV